MAAAKAAVAAVGPEDERLRAAVQPLQSWLDKEVRLRLLDVEEKLDQLLSLQSGSTPSLGRHQRLGPALYERRDTPLSQLGEDAGVGDERAGDESTSGTVPPIPGWQRLLRSSPKTSPRASPRKAEPCAEFGRHTSHETPHSEASRGSTAGLSQEPHPREVPKAMSTLRLVLWQSVQNSVQRTPRGGTRLIPNMQGPPRPAPQDSSTAVPSSTKPAETLLGAQIAEWRGEEEVIETPSTVVMPPRRDAYRGCSTNSGAVAARPSVMELVARQARRAQSYDDIWRVLDDPEANKMARQFDTIACVFIMLSVGTAFIQTVDGPWREFFAVALLECAIDGIYILETIVRFYVCPNRMRFLLSAYNILDVLSGLPLVFRVLVGFIVPPSEECQLLCSVLLGIVPGLRLLKLLRRFQKFRLLLKAFRIALEALPVLTIMYLILCFVIAGAVFIAESRDNIPTYGEALWLTVVSLTTLGYGDYAPKDEVGRFFIGVGVWTSTLYMAIPLGIIGNAFNDVWKDRDRILLMEKVRQNLLQAGLHPSDVPRLFMLFDRDRNGQLDMIEFSWMLEGMQLGLTAERMRQLYQTFDDDKSGGIDHKEFVRALFPESYYEIYGDDKEAVDAQKGRKSADAISHPSDPTPSMRDQGVQVGRDPAMLVL